MVSVRDAALGVHRYVGLLLAAFLIVAGATGSVLAFYTTLDAVVAPELHRVVPRGAGVPLLDPFVLRDRLVASLPASRTSGVVLERHAGESVGYWIDDREVFVDPYDATILGSRRWGDLGEGKKNVLPFLYRLHYSLALGELGTSVFGLVAVVWTLDCFIGAYLTLPRPLPERRRTKAWLSRWLFAWRLKTGKLFSFVFTWHRASGLWVWGMLLVLAWSAVALNLRAVYRPVMSAIFGAADEAEQRLPRLAAPRTIPKLSFRDAYGVARRLMCGEATRRNFRVLSERSIDYDPEHGAYAYVVESTLDVSERVAATTLYFDGDTGQRIFFDAPTGEHASKTLTTWLLALHFGAVRSGGLVYRAFVCVMGAFVTLLAITGVWIWWRKRAKRLVPPRPHDSST